MIWEIWKGVLEWNGVAVALPTTLYHHLSRPFFLGSPLSTAPVPPFCSPTFLPTHSHILNAYLFHYATDAHDGSVDEAHTGSDRDASPGGCREGAFGRRKGVVDTYAIYRLLTSASHTTRMATLTCNTNCVGARRLRAGLCHQLPGQQREFCSPTYVFAFLLDNR